jgi:malate/lactate dehydrogenase
MRQPKIVIVGAGLVGGWAALFASVAVPGAEIIISGVVHPEVEGVPEVCVSLPMLIHAGGAHLLAFPVLDAGEHDPLRCSARAVKEVTDPVFAGLPSRKPS